MTTGKEVTPPVNASDQALLDYIAGLTAAPAASGKSSGTSSVKQSIKLTPATARALMAKAAADADFTGKFTNADVTAFMEQFDAEQSKQLEKVVTTTAGESTAATATSAAKAVDSTMKTSYPSFFDPLQFAKDFVWQKIDFKDETKLGAKTIGTLAEVRGVIESFNLLGVSDTEAKAAAKAIAMGKKTLASYTTELQALAKKEYPTLADRFATDPTLTTYDVASPVINMLAKVWQVDPKTIKLDNPLVASYLRPGGADGKGTPPSYNELLVKAKNDPKYDLTTEANETARSAATALGSALGFGV